MANVPSILLVGDYMVQGGAPGVLAGVGSTGLTELEVFGDLDVLRITPSNASTGAPTAASVGWYPWFDGAYGSTIYAVGSSTSTTITVSPSPGWTTDEWKDRFVSVINSSTIGFSHRRLVTGNTADTITVSAWGGGTPAPGRLFFLGSGAWRDYHAAAGWLHSTEIGVVVSTRGGSSWQAAGNGVGPDAGLIQKLQSIHPAAPRFQLAKYASISNTVGGWNTPGSGVRTAFEAFKSDMDTAWAALATGNTLSWDLIVLDNSQRDVNNWIGTPANALLYQAAVTSTISYLRTTLGNASAKVVLVNHDRLINNAISPNSTLFANRAHRAVAAADANVRVISLEGQRLRGDDPSFGLPAENREFYGASVFWDQYATKVADTYELMLAGSAPAIDNGYPTYILLGDSICVGQVNEAFTTQLNSPTLTGTPRGSEQGIYNRGSGAIEAYDMADNSNTSGTSVTTGGPEVSLMHELEQLHPDGFAVIKRGSNSSALAAQLAPYTGSGADGGLWNSGVSSEHWDELKADYDGALQYINTTLGKQADVRGVFVILGTNDAAVTGGGALFTAELGPFVDDLRDTFGTRTSGKDLPVIWRKPQLDTVTAKPDEILAIRASLEAKALADDQLVLVNVDDLERDATDDIHETPESTIVDGQRLVAALSTIALA